jgi:alkaline phosphatase
VGKSSPDLDLLGLPYTTLNYANGPGYTGASYDKNKKILQSAGSKKFITPGTSAWQTSGEGEIPASVSAATGRPALTNNQVEDPDYLQEAIIPLGAETHGAEDVAIFAGGPKAHLFHGIIEQNVIYHVMAEALGFADQRPANGYDKDKSEKHGK